ncbi:hypothetical protein Tco_0039889 [Tanacetum coccineum]
MMTMMSILLYGEGLSDSHLLNIKEPEDPLIMGEDELSTIPEKDKSSVKDLVPIPSGSKGFSNDICDDESLLKEDDCYDDDTSSDGDSFENIDYVEALPPDYELFSLEEVEDIILHDKLSNVYLLISKIEALNDNPTLSSFSYYDNSFSDHTEETRSGSSTTHANNSLPVYDSFLFEAEPDQGGLTGIVISDNSNNPLLELPEFELFHFDPSFPCPLPEPPNVEISLIVSPYATSVNNLMSLMMMKGFYPWGDVFDVDDGRLRHICHSVFSPCLLYVDSPLLYLSSECIHLVYPAAPC